MKDRKEKDYFHWTKEGDVTIKLSQCIKCKFKTKSAITCMKYTERKPEGVIRNTEACPDFKQKDEK